MKTHWNASILPVTDSILLLSNIKRLNIRPFLTKTAFTRCRKRMLKTYLVDITGPPSMVAYQILSSNGGDLALWPDDRPGKLPTSRKMEGVCALKRKLSI